MTLRGRAMENKDYYQILNIPKDASADDIKRAYRKLARKYHPDVSKETGAEDKFKQVGEAYEVLKDPEKRQAYDNFGSNWEQGAAGQPHWGNYTQEAPENFESIFEDLFGQSNQWTGAKGSPRGEDSYQTIFIDVNDAYQGTTKNIVLRSTEIGTDGYPELKEKTLNVKIPKGVKQGQKIRLQGQAPSSYGAAGDLYLTIDFNTESIYSVKGKDVSLELPISPADAVLGATINVAIPSGNIDLKIPARSTTGKKMRLRGRGIPAKEAGDLYVILKVAIDSELSDEALELYKQLAELGAGDNIRANLKN